MVWNVADVTCKQYMVNLLGVRFGVCSPKRSGRRLRECEGASASASASASACVCVGVCVHTFFSC